MFQNVLCECSLNVPTKICTNVRYKCSLNVPMEGSRNVPFEYSLNIAAERSLNIPFERSTGTFREHCFRTLKKPGHFLSSRNVPMEPSEHSTETFIERSGKVLCIDSFVQNRNFRSHRQKYLENYKYMLK